MDEAPSKQGVPVEPKYFKEARFLLEVMFAYFKDHPEEGRVDERDTVKLIRAKHEAFRDGYMGFDQMLLDIVRELDETTRDLEARGVAGDEEGHPGFFEQFRIVVRCFERYDHARGLIGMMAFTENMELTEPMLRSFLKIKQEFDRLAPDLFNELFVDDLMASENVSYYGKKKLRALAGGLEDAFDRHSIERLLGLVKAVAEEERLYRKSYRLLKKSLRKKFSSYLDIITDVEDLKPYITRVLRANGVDRVPDHLLEKILLDLRKEFFYVHNILPVIKGGLGLELREDFMRNSGLDRAYIEEVENEYLTEEERAGMFGSRGSGEDDLLAI
jgi:uncharacterized protein (TIGR04442 family)